MYHNPMKVSLHGDYSNNVTTVQYNTMGFSPTFYCSVDLSPYWCRAMVGRHKCYRILLLPPFWWPSMAINVSVQYNGGFLPDIIFLTHGHYHRGTRLNAMKRFCFCNRRNNNFKYVVGNTNKHGPLFTNKIIL